MKVCQEMGSSFQLDVLSNLYPPNKLAKKGSDLQKVVQNNILINSLIVYWKERMFCRFHQQLLSAQNHPHPNMENQKHLIRVQGLSNSFSISTRLSIYARENLFKLFQRVIA